MPRLEGMHFYGAEDDEEFIKIANSLENCTHLETYSTCQRCPYFGTCNRLFEGMSGRGASRRLKTEDIDYYRGRYERLVGITI